MRSYFVIAGGILSCCICFGQSVYVGGIGGGMVTSDLSGSFATSVSKRYVVGPELDIDLPLGLGFEADALYRREGFLSTFNSAIDEHANSWEFPLLLKYKFPFPLVKPFVEGGIAPRVISGSINYAPNPSMGTSWPTSRGVVIGGGVQFGIGRLRLAPAVRYTHWNNSAIVVVIPNGPTLQSTQNQVDVLVGVGWKVR